jgi:hypothetical protein
VFVLKKKDFWFESVGALAKFVSGVQCEVVSATALTNGGCSHQKLNQAKHVVVPQKVTYTGQQPYLVGLVDGRRVSFGKGTRLVSATEVNTEY